MKQKHPILVANTDSEDDSGSGTAVITRKEIKTKKPALYKVILLNDDYTPMEFVIEVLRSYFGKSSEDATEIMLSVHQKGRGICGVYSYDVAETKSGQVNEAARQEGHPLQSITEQE